MNSAYRRSLERIPRPGYTPFQSGLTGQAQNEAAFRHFLGIELRRSESSGSSVVLVLVRQRFDWVGSNRAVALTPERIFSALGASVREVDFVGWFREGRVAAATLVQHEASSESIRERVAAGVAQRLRAQLGDAHGLRIRVVVFQRQRRV